MSDTTAESLLAELGRVAASVGPAFAPSGTDALLLSLTDTARQLFGAASCSIALLDEDADELVYTIASGVGAAAVTGMRLPADRGVAGWVVQTGQPVGVSDVTRDLRFAHDVAQSLGYVPTTMIAVPVTSPSRLLGVLALLDRDAGRPGAERDLQLASVFADQAALAIEGSYAFAQLGRVLLATLADAAGAGSSLADAARAAADRAQRPDRDLVQVSSLLADLAGQGTREWRLAVSLLREIAAYSGGRSVRQED